MSAFNKNNKMKVIHASDHENLKKNNKNNIKTTTHLPCNNVLSLPLRVFSKEISWFWLG